ncbi:MAG: tRNA (guanosine(37)-N1)-methyltransferase TrmD [Chloroflexi bacterium]|nr:tRNA (guanosine(37)-N1)-methyltransferase TrmD [Chloroflexota bacterium]
MRVDILTLFPEMFRGPFDESIIRRARERDLVSIHVHNIRDYALDRHRVTDDYPYGGGPGMVMKPDPIFAAAEAALAQGEPAPPDRRAIILMTPQGRPFHQHIADELATYTRLLLICGHYEGVDERVREHLATDELSIGDYVLTGGELPAMVVVDAVVRRIPGVLGCPASAAEESITSGLLEYPQYTRPAEFRGWSVPEMLLSGNHGAIARWRREQALLRTAQRRPDLLACAPLTNADRAFLARVYGPDGLARLLAGQPATPVRRDED